MPTVKQSPSVSSPSACARPEPRPRQPIFSPPHAVSVSTCTPRRTGSGLRLQPYVRVEAATLRIRAVRMCASACTLRCTAVPTGARQCSYTAPKPTCVLAVQRLKLSAGARGSATAPHGDRSGSGAPLKCVEQASTRRVRPRRLAGCRAVAPWRRQQPPPCQQAALHAYPAEDLALRGARRQLDLRMVRKVAESATSAGPHGRTAASHWAMGSAAARPEYVAQHSTAQPGPQ